MVDVANTVIFFISLVVFEKLLKSLVSITNSGWLNDVFFNSSINSQRAYELSHTINGEEHVNRL